MLTSWSCYSAKIKGLLTHFIIQATFVQPLLCDAESVASKNQIRIIIARMWQSGNDGGYSDGRRGNKAMLAKD